MTDKMKKLPEIYAQTTVQNDRIISLLSSVLMRKLSIAFFPAIRHRFPSSMETGAIRFAERKDPVAIVFVRNGKKNNVNNETTALLEAAIQNTAIFSMSVTLKGSPWRDTQELDRVFQLLDVNVRAVFVALSGTMDFLVSYLSARQIKRMTLKGLCGAVSLFPETINVPRNSGVFLSVPILCIVDSTHQEWIVQQSRQNPNQISVVVPFTCEMDPEGMEALWIARTVLKYVNVVSLMADESQLSKGMTNSAETTRPCQQLASRL